MPPPDQQVEQIEFIYKDDQFILIALLKNGEIWRRIWAKEDKPEYEWTQIPGPYD